MISFSNEATAISHAFEKLKQEGRAPNFLFVGAGTPHATYFSSFALFARDRDIHLSGVIYDCAQKSRPNHFSHEHIIGLDREDYIMLRRFSRTMSKKSQTIDNFKEMVRGCMLNPPVSKNGRKVIGLEELSELRDPFFFIYPATGLIPSYAIQFLLSLDREIIHIVLEEGIGSYLMTERDWWFMARDREHHPIVKVAKSAVLHALWPLIKDKQNRANEWMVTSFFTLFENTDEGLEVNKISCRYCKVACELIAKRKHVPNIDFSNTIIVATSKFGCLGAEKYEKDTLEIVLKILRDKGYRIVLRPHPGEPERDSFEDFPVEIDKRTDVPLESLIAVSKQRPVAILGFLSSSQIIAKALWGVGSICIIDVLYEEWNDLAKRNSAIRLSDQEVRRAKRMFRGYIDFPYGVEQLEKAIRLLKG